MGYGLGIDIGGTKTAVGLSDGSAIPCKIITFPTKPERGAEDLVRRIAEQAQALMQEYGVARIDFAGLACPGPLDVKRGKIVHIATMGFVDVPIRQMLEQALGVAVYLENDASCAALAEYAIGVAKGADPLVYVTVSTGIGCGIVAGGRILSGAHSSAGEIGHVTVEANGRPCPCGKRGCLELYASGTAIGNDAGMDAKSAFDLARSGDAAMVDLVTRAADRLGLGLSTVYHLIDPQAVVLGGSVTRSYDVFAAPLADALAKYTQPIEGREVKVHISEFDGDQGVIGAVLYGQQQHQLRSLL
ncbi:MAG: ROK family protein [Clostridia bacterium]|nr:ROK family protein [Clostridia bacterium]